MECVIYVRDADGELKDFTTMEFFDGPMGLQPASWGDYMRFVRKCRPEVGWTITMVRTK
jgi:hypothetical protein